MFRVSHVSKQKMKQPAGATTGSKIGAHLTKKLEFKSVYWSANPRKPTV